ncbi:ABC transporter ATP-binding protein [Spiroplasma tabanidicola]|uniref:ABC transporter ATP-binding protein n=1 Tax=Spiroplasma tabanidicola TaxID=324079 RepID=A0A6I6C4Y9_9MOLU|nr:ABC transporter ATP-binding protein [Spiroplasma tabanidicola]QGS51897.1 ABC transporter ATP-binding protein [Spiroplasma tabanidicola]
MKEKIIELKNIQKVINNKLILDKVNISFECNSFTTIIGMSGSGKTTLLNILCGLEYPTHGEVFVKKTNINNLKKVQLTKFRSLNIGYIFQDYNLIDYLNVKENILITLMVNKQKVDKIKYLNILKFLDLEKIEFVVANELSGGEKQRVAIARTLVGENKIIIADEPTGSLDFITAKKVIKLLKEAVNEFDKTLIVVTHDPNVAKEGEKTFVVKNNEVKMLKNKFEISEIEYYLSNDGKNE